MTTYQFAVRLANLESLLSVLQNGVPALLERPAPSPTKNLSKMERGLCGAFFLYFSRPWARDTKTFATAEKPSCNSVVFPGEFPPYCSGIKRMLFAAFKKGVIQYDLVTQKRALIGGCVNFPFARHQVVVRRLSHDGERLGNVRKNCPVSLLAVFSSTRNHLKDIYGGNTKQIQRSGVRY